MVRKRASLQGRGNEILMGARQDAQAETVTESESQSVVRVDEPQASSMLEQEPERGSAAKSVEPLDSGDDGEELSPEWADLLQEEALSALGNEPSALDGDTTTDIDLPLPPLATTPARPNRLTDETPEATRLRAGEAIPEAEEPASEPAAMLMEAAEVSEDVAVYVESDPVPAIGGATEEATELEHEPLDGTQVSEPHPDLHPKALGSRAVAEASMALEEPTPPAPMYFESYGSVSAEGAYVPAPKEKPEATDLVMRAKLGGLLYRQSAVKPSDEDLEPGGPGAPELATKEIEGYESGQPSRARGEPEISAMADREQRSTLWDETLELYEVVPDVLSGDANQGHALRLLQEAQEILLKQPGQFDVAKFNVGRVQALISWRRNVNRWSKTYGWGVLVYEVAWIVALVLGVFSAGWVANLVTSMVGGALGSDGLSRLWSTMMWGGLGGVIGALYSLYWHVSKVRDFDKQYTMWYIVQPVVGLLLGALVHLLIGWGLTTAQGVNQEDQTLRVLLFPCAVACIVGFRQRSVLEMIDRVIQVLTPSSQSEQSSVEETNAEEPLDASE